MRKVIFAILGSIVVGVAPAQTPFSLKQDAAVIVYSLPKTEFAIEVKMEKVTETPGQFYKYSERYLATKNVILQEKTNVKLLAISVKTQAIADPQRTYTFVPDKWTPDLHLTINKKGILTGVNVTPVLEVPAQATVTQPAQPNSTNTPLLPLGEEYMLAGSEAKLAEGAAKQIYRIRESRLGLLTADVEKLPADGASFKAMLDGLNKMEKELTELFIGKTTVTTETKTLFMTPEVALNNKVLFRLSPLRGVVEADDLSGAPYYISVVPTTINVTPADPKAKTAKVVLQSVLPAATELTINDGVNTWYNGQFFVPQFGKVIAVPSELFGNASLKMQYDVQTGRILTIE